MGNGPLELKLLKLGKLKSSRACGGGGWCDEGSWGSFSSCLGFPTLLVGCLPTNEALMEEGDRFLDKSFSPTLFFGVGGPFFFYSFGGWD